MKPGATPFSAMLLFSHISQMTIKRPPDGRLRLVRAGDDARRKAREARGPNLADLYRQHAPYVAAVASRILGGDHYLEDLVQDVFVDALRGLRGLREPAAVRGWLAKIAVRAAVRRLRRRRLLRLLQLESGSMDHDQVIDPAASPHQRALIIRVYEALSQLPAVDRAAWVLRHVEGEDLAQAAELCGCSLSTYQRRLRRAAAHLERELGHD